MKDLYSEFISYLQKRELELSDNKETILEGWGVKVMLPYLASAKVAWESFVDEKSKDSEEGRIELAQQYHKEWALEQKIILLEEKIAELKNTVKRSVWERVCNV